MARPLKFRSVKELQKKIDEYFELCKEEKKPYTITGLALALCTTRDLLVDYESKDKFSDTIKRAKLKIHNYAEESLFTRNNTSGVIFNLKNNFGWNDKTETELSTPKDQPLQIENVSDDELNRRTTELLNKIGEIGVNKNIGGTKETQS